MFSDIKYFFKISFPTLSIFFLTFINLFISNNFFDFGQLFVFQAIFFWMLYLPQLLPLFIILISARYYNLSHPHHQLYHPKFLQQEYLF